MGYRTCDNKIIKLPPVNYINSLEKILKFENDIVLENIKYFIIE